MCPIKALAYQLFLKKHHDRVLRHQRQVNTRPLPCWYDEKTRRWEWIESSS